MRGQAHQAHPPGRLCLEAALGFARQLNAAVGIRRSPSAQWHGDTVVEDFLGGTEGENWVSEKSWPMVVPFIWWLKIQKIAWNMLKPPAVHSLIHDQFTMFPSQIPTFPSIFC